MILNLCQYDPRCSEGAPVVGDGTIRWTGNLGIVVDEDLELSDEEERPFLNILQYSDTPRNEEEAETPDPSGSFHYCASYYSLSRSLRIIDQNLRVANGSI